jgi:hypothetical protein
LNNSDKIVIDASIARSAGPRNGTFPLSKDCRDFLEAVRESEMFAVFSQEILQEWKKHQSNFAVEWRTSMMAKRKILYFKDSLVDEILRNRIEKASPNEQIFAIMLKDCRLLEAALATDKNVASLDDKVRRHFSTICPQIHEIREIVWVNPGKQEEQPLDWLNDGAKNEVKRQLRNYNPDTE